MANIKGNDAHACKRTNKKQQQQHIWKKENWKKLCV